MTAEKVTRAQMKAGKGFQTQYTENGSPTVQQFYTREANDGFASAMELMGVTEITKSYYDPLVRQWLPYEKDQDIFYTSKI